MTVAVVIPVVLLAAGAEARIMDRRSRVRRARQPILDKEVDAFKSFLQGLPDLGSNPKIGPFTLAVLRACWWTYRRYFLPFSFFMPLYRLFGGYFYVALAWGMTIIALTVGEVGNLVWLAGDPAEAAGWGWLAVLSVVSIAAGMVLLLTVPTVRLFWFRLVSEDLRKNGPSPDLQVLLTRKLGLVLVEPAAEDADAAAQRVSGPADAPTRQVVERGENEGSS